MVYNKYMKTTLPTLARKAAIHLSAFGLLAFASTSIVLGDEQGLVNPIKAKSLTDLFQGIISVVIELGTILSVLGIMYGGYLYVTAQGNEEKLGAAQKTITWALVGTAVLLGARTIMTAIRGTVEQLGSGVTN
jgi:hypothetical protein